MTRRTYEGRVFRGRDLEVIEGRVVTEDGTIVAIEAAEDPPDQLIVPAFINAHTHLGDSIAKEPPQDLTLEELVAPPDGLKHRLLRSAEPEALIAGMRRSLELMKATGTGACFDFREGGQEGVKQLREAAAGMSIDALAFGRGDPSVLDLADGYGASGAADGSFDAPRQEARTRDKPFGIHAGEVDSADINPAMDLEPEFLVHMVHAESLHFERLMESETPVVCCPRSNVVTDVGFPPIAKLLAHTTVALGTDNVMLNAPSMLEEMAFTARLTDLPDRSILKMATVNGAELLDREDGVIAEGRPARFVVFDGESPNLVNYRDPHRAIVRRATRSDTADIVLDAPAE